jgi:3-oxoacyl-[acyl-carrier protein] reductase
MYDMQNLLEGKTAVVTGCNRGIGKAILQKLCEHGADVFAVVRKRTPEFEQLCDSYMQEYGIEIISVEADFLDEKQVADAAKKIVSYKKDIDILIKRCLQ